MSKEVDSGALRTINRVLGIAGATSPGTELETEQIVQTLDLNPYVRRGRVVGNLSGWYMGLLQNVHVAAGDLDSLIDPYEPGDSAIAPYPASVPRGWDVWVLGICLDRSTGAGTLAGAVVGLNPLGRSQGWGQNNSGAGVGSTPNMPIARFVSVNADAAGTLAIGVSGNGSTYVETRLRVPRGATLTLDTTAAGASATFRALFFCGVFPEGLGQDVLG